MSIFSHPTGLGKAQKILPVPANLSSSHRAARPDPPSSPARHVEKLDLSLASSLLFCVSLQLGLSPEQDAVYVLLYALAAEAFTLLHAPEANGITPILAGVVSFAAASSVVARSLWSFYRPRQHPVKIEDGKPRPMFFPVQTSHTRLFPKVHSLSYPFMWTGIPIGFRGNIGGVLSCERRIEGLRPACFTIDACDYMHRGDDHIGLDGKLREFLISQGANPKAYPYAYLLTVAKFSGHAFNPVSFWYLYSSHRTLSAVILEVNNTFGERHPYFLDCSSTPESAQSNAPTRFTSTFRKDFFVSPFSDRSGSYSLVTNDPLYPSMTGVGPIKLCLTLSSNEGKPKVVARVYSNGNPIDPTALSWWQVQRFAMSKAWDTWATEPRTVYQAALLMFKRGLSIFTVPEPLKTSISRKAKDYEVVIEGAFRQWLKTVVNNTNSELQVNYISAGIPGVTLETSRSTEWEDEHGKVTTAVNVRVLTPLFYARMIRYGSVAEALVEETRQGQTVEVTGLDELFNAARNLRPALGKKHGLTARLGATAISMLRRPPRSLQDSVEDEAFTTMKSLHMNDLSSAITDTEELNVYQNAVMKVLLSDWLALSNMDLLAMERFVVRLGLIWLVGNGLQNILHQLLE